MILCLTLQKRNLIEMEGGGDKWSDHLVTNKNQSKRGLNTLNILKLENIHIQHFDSKSSNFSTEKYFSKRNEHKFSGCANYRRKIS